MKLNLLPSVYCADITLVLIIVSGSDPALTFSSESFSHYELLTLRKESSTGRSALKLYRATASP